MLIMKIPDTLPWRRPVDGTPYCIECSNDNTILIHDHSDDPHIDYIIHSANNYPKAIELLRELNTYRAWVPQSVISRVEDFLKTIDDEQT